MVGVENKDTETVVDIHTEISAKVLKKHISKIHFETTQDKRQPLI